MKIKNKGGYVVPIAIGVLVVASLGLLFFSWWGGTSDSVIAPSDVTNTSGTLNGQSTATDDTTLDAEGAIIDAQLEALDSSNVEVDNSLNDTSSI